MQQQDLKKSEMSTLNEKSHKKCNCKQKTAIQPKKATVGDNFYAY